MGSVITKSGLLIAALLLTVPAVLPQVKPANVLEYYKLLPDKFFEADKSQRINWMLDSKRGAIVDLQNGYIFAPGDGAQTDVYLTLFKRPDRNYVIAVKYHAVDTQDLTYLEFYVYQNGSWKAVTDSVLPLKTSAELKYELPRFGKTIRVFDHKGKPLYSLRWSGEKFRLRK